MMSASHEAMASFGVAGPERREEIRAPILVLSYAKNHWRPDVIGPFKDEDEAHDWIGRQPNDGRQFILDELKTPQ